MFGRTAVQVAPWPCRRRCGRARTGGGYRRQWCQPRSDPQLVRLLTWLRLERQPTGALGRAADHEPKLTEIARAQAAGRVRAGDPFDLFTLVLSMAFAWSAASVVYAATADEPDEDHDRRRTLLAACVRAAISPTTTPQV
ncbi:hypothetical protein [Micromonospora sp. NPDC002575]|uniref:hypothetical protein n=1 Tax=Micromonospora sp. NPDC002575 TaxID=3364222 RepID=UPI00368D37E1